jgi:biopolymer transport protein TolR
MEAAMGLPVGSHASQPRINVAPLVEVVLVLLIVFIVVTPAVEAKVRLPEARNASPAGGKEPLQLALLPDGTVRVEDARSGSATFLLPLCDAGWDGIGSLEGRAVLVHADAGRSYRDVQALLDRVRDLGAREARQVTAQGREGGRR